jgi:hypothetical protein
VNESNMEHAQEAIEEFHARLAKKKRKTWWGHHLFFSGAKCHIKCTTSSCKWNKGPKTSKRLYHENFCIKASRVVKWHWTNGTILRRPKSKSNSYFGVKGNLAPKEEASKVSLWWHAQALSASQRVSW